MPFVATPEQEQQSALLEQMLTQRGLIAKGGNIRSLPFSDEGRADPLSNGSASANGPIPSSNGASTTRPPGASPLIKDNNLIDPTTGQPLEGSVADDWWKYLLAGAGIGGGVALADALRKRKGGAEKVPLVEGEVITDPLAALPDNQSIVNGEYTEVNDPARLTGPQAANTNEPSAAGVLADRQKQLTSRNMPRANPVPQTDTSVVRGTDAMSDISPEEIENAKALVQQLVTNRTKGNAAKASQSRFSRRAVQPTGPTDSGTQEGLLNTIIRLMRESGATRVLPRAM